ncbi:glycosyltransferase [Sulfurovum mangrovi]|uniref:glycosyltransferase n=1 Tax=Sulfurovum mangrovi TaxID=2893889 RepID=UPI001E3F31E3|nr:glycosyltransferase [Sulfurovum mangrovi]UFH58846.1 glycosyltransferase [Sulfurovum mangrovi]
MKVCQVLASRGDGGLEKHTIELVKGLYKNGIDVTVIAHKDLAKHFKDIRFIPMDLEKSRNNVWMLYRLYKVLKNESFDIIHAQANKATSIIVKLKPFLHSKIVATLHNYKKNLKPFLKADAVITVSDRIGEKLNCKYKTTVYNGIETSTEKMTDLHETFNINKDKFIISSVGRLVEAKGFDLLIESMQYVDNDICLLIIGDGPLREKLENLSEKFHVTDKIKFLGSLDNSFTKSIIKSSDLLVISSRREGFSYVFAESLLLDTPIVSTDVADIKKFITEEFIVPFDAVRLAKKTNMFRANCDQNIATYQVIFNKAKNTFTLENMANQTIQVYKSVVS